MGSYRGVPGTIKGVQGKLSRRTWHYPRVEVRWGVYGSGGKEGSEQILYTSRFVRVILVGTHAKYPKFYHKSPWSEVEGPLARLIFNFDNN